MRKATHLIYVEAWNQRFALNYIITTSHTGKTRSFTQVKNNWKNNERSDIENIRVRVV